MTEGEKVTHESFGLVSISRVQGNARLFGSFLERHSTYFVLEVRQAEVEHYLGRDWYYPRENLIEIQLSAAQFAEMITTLNMGTGVPCTVHRVQGSRRKPLPEMTTEASRIQSDFASTFSALVTYLEDQKAKAQEILSKKTMSIADKKSIMNILDRAIREVGANAPHFLESFQESTGKVVSQAKAEVDAFMTHAMHTAGLKSLQSSEDTIQILKDEND